MEQKKRRLIEQELPESVTTRPIKGSLLKATQNGNFDLVRELVERGTNINEKTRDGETPLRVAMRKNFNEIASYLMEHSAVFYKAETFNKREFLHCAASSNSVGIAESLLKQGASVDALDRWKCTPLHHAVGEGHEAMAMLLLKNGANPNSKNSHGITPLHIAAIKGFYPILLLLLNNKKVDCNKVTATGDTALHMAAEKGYENMVSALLAHGADTEIINKKGYTPLDIAEEMPLLRDEERNKASDSERTEKYERIKVMLEQTRYNRSWFSSYWVQGGSILTIIAALGIFCYHYFSRKG
jgi:ankyrin repeat protein